VEGNDIRNRWNHLWKDCKWKKDKTIL